MAGEYPYKKFHAIFISWRDNHIAMAHSIESAGIAIRDNYTAVGDSAIRLYLGSKDPASKESSLADLRTWLQWYSDPHSLILIYYDGHGKADQGGKLHFYPQ
jgi:hypothetical protein